MKKRYWEEIFIALSLANLLLAMSWRRLIYPNSAVYHIKFIPSYLDYLSVMLLVIIVAGMLLGGLCLLRYFLKEKATFIARLIFFALLLCIGNAVRMAFPTYQLWLMKSFGIPTLLIFFGFVGVVSLILMLKFWDSFFSVFRTLVLIVSPFVLITFFNATNQILTSSSDIPNTIEFQKHNVTTSNKPKIKSRVVWIVFDELDYRVPFEILPEDVKMPEFDRFRKESLTATNATAPNYETLQSIPSLLVGKKVEKAVPSGKNELMLNFSDVSNATKFSQTSTIFSDVKNLGGNSAIVGWYHAYCRVLKKDLSECHWESYDFSNDFKSQSFSQSIRRDLYNLITSIPLAIRYLKVLEDSDYIDRHKRMLSATNQVISNPEIDLTFIHLPIPHPPYRYNSKLDKFVDGGDYLENLVLTDKVLGEIRQSLEKANLWDDSVVIISSDHQWRLYQLKFDLLPKEFEMTKGIEDQRIPFFVKMKSQKESLQYETPFNTVITRDLINIIMKGELSTAVEVKNWLDENTGN